MYKPRFLMAVLITVSFFDFNVLPVRAASFTYGDANGDGLINAVDITKIERMIAGLDVRTLGANANGDAFLNAVDITKIERIIAGIDNTTSTDSLDVYFIDVGQGDSILLDYGQTEVLIDGGNPSPGVTTFIQPYVQEPLDAVIATHMDADHIGGLTAVLNGYNVTDIWTNNATSTSQTYNNFMAAVNANAAAKHVARRGDIISVGLLSFTVDNPSDLSGSSNNNSIVLDLAFGGVTFQFEADAEQAAEANMLAAGVIHHADILKVGHHGARSSSTPAFLAVVQPGVAVYMCELNNTYGHPAPETIANLTAVGAAIYGTDKNGTVKVTTDGRTYTIVKSR